jgi:hypothetical protein
MEEKLTIFLKSVRYDRISVDTLGGYRDVATGEDAF